MILDYYLNMLFSGALFFIIVRNNDIRILTKSGEKRSQKEKEYVNNGLYRNFFLDLLLFLPVSVSFMYIISPIFLPEGLSTDKSSALYALLGAISYGFPFASIKAIMTRVTLQMLKEAAFLEEEMKPKSKDDSR